MLISSTINAICWADSAPPTIDTIVIDNRNIFSADSLAYNHWFFKLANRLHIKTRKYVISREILQNTGEPFSRELADETERNLRALPYLWDARVDYDPDENNNGIKIKGKSFWHKTLSINLMGKKIKKIPQIEKIIKNKEITTLFLKDKEINLFVEYEQ